LKKEALKISEENQKPMLDSQEEKGLLAKASPEIISKARTIQEIFNYSLPQSLKLAELMKEKSIEFIIQFLLL